MVTKEKLEAVLRRSADDEPASLVIAGLIEGLNRPEIARRFKITVRQVKTTKERIRRRALQIEADDVE